MLVEWIAHPYFLNIGENSNVLLQDITYLQLKRRYIITSHRYLELKLLVYDWKKQNKTRLEDVKEDSWEIYLEDNYFLFFCLK